MPVPMGLALAFVFALWPLPTAAAWLRPALLALAAVYLGLFRPHQFSPTTAWLAGLAVDLLGMGTWGATALTLATASYCAQLLGRRLFGHTLLKQTLWVAVILGLAGLAGNALKGFSLTAWPWWAVLGQALLTAALWPPLLYLAGRASPRASLV